MSHAGNSGAKWLRSITMATLFCATALPAGSALHAQTDPTAAPATAPATAPTRLQPPDDATVKAHLALVNDVFATDFHAAATSEKKNAMARKLLDAGLQEKDNASRFALLLRARDLADEGVDPELAETIIDTLDQGYVIDRLKMSAESLAGAARVARTPADVQDVAGVAGHLVDRALLADRYDLARTVAAAVLAAARVVEVPDLIRESAAGAQQVREVEAAFNALKEPLARLAAKPDDPGANLKVGRFRCFVKGDWEGGLPLLARGSDAALAGLAADELAGVTGPDAQLKLADRWWDIAPAQAGPAAAQVQRHAGKWYTAALPHLSGLMLVRVQKRLDALQAVAGVAPAPLASNLVLGIWLFRHTAAPLVDSRGKPVVVKGEFQWVADDAFTKPTETLEMRKAQIAWAHEPALALRRGSITAWLRWDGRPVLNALVCKGSPGYGPGGHCDYGITIEPGGKLSSYTCWPLSPNSALAQAPPLPVERWIFVAYSWAERQQAFWINGQPAGAAALPGPIRITAGPLTLGSDPPGDLEFFHGRLAGMHLYNTPLTDAQAKTLMDYETKFMGIKLAN